ncbi:MULTISPECIES: cell division protein FtsZ [Methylococcus]|uniref:Cell division protein FtsZ n=1 Tax=Methylococcus capsulatus TaxID=414 RepID=A0ABZ2FAX0_METCP|nr:MULTISPECIES: cell division protein FtsZ [Methylococcus]MDF9391302.1 cell division protein FtsZ [Methylococcus capsulatus]
MKFELVDSFSPNAVIKVIGVGGGGGNAVNHMVSSQIEGVDFICANTDAQALRNLGARTVIQLGNNLTKGLGAGANPDIGRQAALDDRERILEVLDGADMVFITAGMGGGTGTGAAPVIAEIAKEAGILTVAVVTKPFPFEGRKRRLVADKGIAELSQFVDSLITIPNEKLLPVLGKDVSLMAAFAAANDVLLGAVQGIAELITRPGLINVDFADVRTVMSEMGVAMMGTGVGSGPTRARDAAERAIASPLLEDISLSGAKGILVNITGGLDLAIGEFDEVGNAVKDYASDEAMVVIGTVIDPEMQDEVRVTVVATGLSGQSQTVSDAPLKLVHKQTGEIDYEQMQRPTVLRKQPKHEPRGEPSKEMDLEYLDIPAFLRRQAD